MQCGEVAKHKALAARSFAPLLQLGKSRKRLSLHASCDRSPGSVPPPACEFVQTCTSSPSDNMALKTSNHIRHVLLAALVTLLGLSCGVVIASSLTHSSIRDLAEWTVNDPVLDIGDTIKYLRGLPQSLAVYPITLGIIAGSVAIMTASFGIVVAVFMWPSGRTVCLFPLMPAS